MKPDNNNVLDILKAVFIAVRDLDVRQISFHRTERRIILVT